MSVLRPIRLSHSLLQITRRTPSPDWSVQGLGVHWQRINGARPTQTLVSCTMPRENDEIPEELVKYIYSKLLTKYLLYTVELRRMAPTVIATALILHLLLLDFATTLSQDCWWTFYDHILYSYCILVIMMMAYWFCHKKAETIYFWELIFSESWYSSIVLAMWYSSDHPTCS